MFAHNTRALLTLLALFFCGELNAANGVSFDRESRGLRLEAKITPGADWANAEVECRLTNISPQSIMCGVVTAAAGFYLELEDSSHQRIPPLPTFRRLFVVYNQYTAYNLGEQELKPQQSIGFRAQLGEVFALAPGVDYTLTVRWERGVAEGRYWPVDPDLRLDVMLPANAKVPRLLDSSLASSRPPQPKAEKAPISAAVENSQSKPEAKVSDSKPDYLPGAIAVALAVGAAFLWLILRRKNKSEEQARK